jgi:hypothetical protein
MPYWNVDMSLAKSVKVLERASLQFSMIFTNVFNHNVLYDPGMAPDPAHIRENMRRSRHARTTSARPTTRTTPSGCSRS